jgi:hypothetical protein
MTEENKTSLSNNDLLDIKETLKKQIIEELKDDNTLKMEEAKIRRDEEREEQSKYINKMKTSPDPWVDIVGWVQTQEGVKVELEWNDPFVDYLRSNGVTGTDDEQVVQKWVALLMRDMADQMDERYGSDYE